MWLLTRFTPLIFNAIILIEDFERMWKIQNREFHEYLKYNILYGHIVFNDGHGYGVLEHDKLCGCICIVILLQVGGGIQQILFEAHHNSYIQADLCHGEKGPHTGYDWKEGKGRPHGGIVVSTKAKGSTIKLCSQKCGKRNNDINQLVLYNKRANLHVAKTHLGKTPWHCELPFLEQITW